MKYLKITLSAALVSFATISCDSPKDRQNMMVEVDEGANNVVDLSESQICTELLPPPGPDLNILYESDTSIFYRNKNQNDTLIKNSFQSNAAYIAALKDYYWPSKDLKVMFLDGNPIVQDKVKASAKKWESHCSIRFNFGTFPDPDITISFLYKGSWSYIGTYSKQNSPSMNFGWLISSTPDVEYDRVVLHEFGHALGFIHEHQNPNGNIPWDVAKVYDYYKQPPNNWDKPKVDTNIFHKYAFNQVNATVFDPKSIMLYAIPASLTTNGFSTTSNSELSVLDKTLVGSIYSK